jgi:hypothetical protein
MRVLQFIDQRNWGEIMNTSHLLLVLALLATTAASTAADKVADPLENYYGNTLISERLINKSGFGGAAHVWLERDHTYISFDVNTGGRSGTYSLKGEPGKWQLCMNYPAPMGTLCYPIEPRRIGETWIASDPGTMGKNSLVRGHQ